LAKRGWRSANLSPDRRVFFGQGRGDVRSRALAARVTASFGSRGGASTNVFSPLIPSPFPVIAGATSPDGVTWTPFFNEEGLTGIAAAQGGLLAATGVIHSIYTSTDSGVTWTPRLTLPLDGIFRGIAVGDVVAQFFVAVGENSVQQGLIYTSEDGTNWAEQDVPSCTSYSSVASVEPPGVIIATGIDESSLLPVYARSVDGSTWSGADTGGVLGDFRAAAVVNRPSLVLTPGLLENTIALSLDDGETWQPDSNPVGKYLGGIFNRIVGPFEGYLVLVRDPGDGTVAAAVAMAPDLSDFTIFELPGSEGDVLQAVAANADLFVAVGFSLITLSGVIYTSADGGTSWTKQTVPAVHEYTDVTRDGNSGLFIATAT